MTSRAMGSKLMRARGAALVTLPTAEAPLFHVRTGISAFSSACGAAGSSQAHSG